MFVAVGQEYPELKRLDDLSWGTVRDPDVQAPFLITSMPQMERLGDVFSFVLVDSFTMVSLSKKVSVFGGGVYRSMKLTDPFLVSFIH